MPRVWTDEQKREAREASLARLRAGKQRIADQKKLDESGYTLTDVAEPLEDPAAAVDMREHTWLGKPGSSNYIPSWYTAHSKNFEVKSGGKPLGFRIRDVLPYRRWAIRQDGELLDQRDFEDLYERYISEISPKGVDPKVQFIPRVERFVNARPDPSGGPGLIAINFDPEKAPGPDDGVRYDPVKQALVTLAEQAREAATTQKRAQLDRMFLAKEISAETFERELRALSPDLYEQPEAPPPAA